MSPVSPPRPFSQQRGAVLFVALIMLILVTLLALAAMRMATTNLQLVNNQQFRAEADAAANFALDQAMNDSNFINNTASSTYQMSLSQDDSTSDPKALTVTVTPPTCKRYRYIKKSELVKNNSVSPEDVVCLTGQSSSGVLIVTPDIGSLTDNSLCATALFDVQASITDNTTGASVTHSQGIEARMDISAAESKCK